MCVNLLLWSDCHHPNPASRGSNRDHLEGKTLAELAELLNGLCEAELLIPAARVYDVVALRSRKAIVADVSAHLGLVIGEPGQTQSSY